MRVAFHTLGCKVNQYETEAIREAFVRRGATVVGEEDPADVYIVNTCTVTNIADRKSRQYIRRMKALNPAALMVVTGCYAQVAAEAVAAMPEVDLVIGNNLKSQIADRVFETFAAGRNGEESSGGDEGGDALASTYWTDVLAYEALNTYEDFGVVTAAESGKCRAYVKVQDGCNRFCSYCKTPYARGQVRSRAPEDVVAEARTLIENGYREIVLTGINTALYGTEPGFAFDRAPEEAGMTGLEAVLSRLNAIDADFRIRLSSLEPTVVDKTDVERLLRFDKLCRHLHLSIQSGSDHVLGLMNRHYTVAGYLEIVAALRAFDPCYNVTTDIIAGFPGETAADHAETVALIGQAGFGRAHIFRYSPRPGTRAAAMPEQVEGRTKAVRAADLTRAADAAAADFIAKNGSIPHRFLAEERDGDFVTGYTGNYIKVYVDLSKANLSKDTDASAAVRTGAFYTVRLTGPFRDGALGELIG